MLKKSLIAVAVATALGAIASVILNFVKDN